MAHKTQCVVRKCETGFQFEGGDLDKLNIFSMNLSKLVNKKVIVEYRPNVRTVSVLSVVLSTDQE
jgi:hypothetical protein